MISIQIGMLVALGFFIASLAWLLLASAFWSRAVRLTTERLKRSMPVSEAEIRADRDRLRAEHAIKVHSIEKRLDHAKHERAKHIIDINRRDARISLLETEIVTIRSEAEEHQNARRVLEQTVVDRLPKVEARLGEAKRVLFNRDREIAELTHSAKHHKLALEEATSINAQKNAEIERLNTALVTRGGRSRRSDARIDGAVASNAEVESLRTKTREQAALIDRLQRQPSQGFMLPGSAAASANADMRDLDILQETLSEAEAELRAARGSPPKPAEPATASAPDKGKEIRALEAQIEDQAGEIARLKAALASLEQTSAGAGLKDSKIALKARAGSAEALTERQGATIAKLRAELAAANERLARQAAHFMDEMRQLGGGPTNGPSNGIGQRRPTRDGEGRKLVERVALVRPALAEKARALTPASAATAVASADDASAGNGHHAPQAVPASERAPEPVLAVASAGAPAAAEMPQTTAIPEERRKLRLLDRITSLSKS